MKTSKQKFKRLLENQKNELGLNSHHQAAVLSYMKFARYLRNQSVKTVEDAFTNANKALFDDTYTQDEVKKILENLQTLLTCDVEEEMRSFMHNNVLMLQQLFTQAENWHLRMEVQLSELQNRDLLEMIRQLEADETILKPPVEKDTTDNSEALLRLEIERLRNENQRFQDQQRDVTDALERTQEELQSLKEKLKLASSEMQAYRTMAEPLSSGEPADNSQMSDMADKLEQLEKLLETDQESSKEKWSKLQAELNSTKEEVVQVQAQLQLAELELERKFNETKAYANMKQILINKNGQINQLRSKIQQLGGKESGDSEEDN